MILLSRSILLAIMVFFFNSAQANIQDVKTYNFTTRDAISVEVLAGKIAYDAGKGFSGEVYLYWNNNDFTQFAQHIRKELIAHGINPYQIILKQERGGFTENSYQGIKVYLRNVVLRVPECRGKALNYKYRSDDTGCTLNNIIDQSLVNPFSYQM
jgi:hypothetical protein